jgi:hypothetical protein
MRGLQCNRLGRSRPARHDGRLPLPGCQFKWRRESPTLGRIHVAPSPLQAFNSVSHCLDSRAADTIVFRLLLLLLLLGHDRRPLLTLSMTGLGPWTRHTEAYSRDRPVGEEKSETFRMHV